jgi:hypothetical protein
MEVAVDRSTAAERPGIPAWYRAYLERRRTRILRLHVLVAELGALAEPRALAAPGPAARVEN